MLIKFAVYKKLFFEIYETLPHIKFFDSAKNIYRFLCKFIHFF